MKQSQQNFCICKTVKLALLYAVFFVLLSALYVLIQKENVAVPWKIIASGLVFYLIFRSISKEQIVCFSGFCMLMVGHTLLWLSGAPVLLKIMGSAVVLLQFFSTLKNETKKEEPHGNSVTSG